MITVGMVPLSNSSAAGKWRRLQDFKGNIVWIKKIAGEPAIINSGSDSIRFGLEAHTQLAHPPVFGVNVINLKSQVSAARTTGCGISRLTIWINVLHEFKEVSRTLLAHRFDG